MRARIADIVFHAARLSEFTEAEVKGACRSKTLVRVRQAVCLVAREQKRFDGEFIVHAHTFPTIAAALGKDHSTIIHAVRKAEDMVQRDPQFSRFVDDLRQAVKQGTAFAELNMPKVKVAKPSIPAAPSLRERRAQKPKPKKSEKTPCKIGNYRFSLDENGNSETDAQDLTNIATACRKLADAINLARAA